jgi:glycosyltransferase involved in cell wall biosynthesis
MPRNFSISAYTTTYNCLEMEYPFEQCIESLFGFADEIVVVDAGSTDGTLERLESIAKRESRFKFVVSAVDFSHPRWAIYQDGYLKAKARNLCTAEYCWQIDSDEIVPSESYDKIWRLPELLSGFQLVMLPMVEFWGSFERIRGDFFAWKPRFSVNDPRITHGIPESRRLYDTSGHEYPKPYVSDSCNYMYSDTGGDVSMNMPLPITDAEKKVFKDATTQQIEDLYFRCLDELPYVLHLSWLDFPRKIRHYQKFWQSFHASMYNMPYADTAEGNMFFDKPWSEVTEADIAKRSEDLRQLGPRNFHKKFNPKEFGISYNYTRPIPEAVRRWSNEQRRITITDRPLVSAIVPSYNKAPFLRQSIGSLASQNYPEMEILVVNDGSPDNTNEVVRELQRDLRDVRIELLEKKNGGISDARNYAIERAQGSLILLLDGDDIAKQGFVSAAVERITRHKDNLICTNVELFGSSTGEWLPRQYDPETILYDNCIPTLTVFERWLWERSGGFNVCFPFVEDWNYWVTISRLNPKVFRLPEKYFLYRSSEDGLAHLFTDSHSQCAALILTAHEEIYQPDEIIGAHMIFRQMRPVWRERFEKQDLIHPNEWLLKLWLGLFAEVSGDIARAIEFYQRSCELSDYKRWQPSLRLAVLNQQLNNGQIANDLFQIAAKLCPDLSRIFSVPAQQPTTGG